MACSKRKYCQGCRNDFYNGHNDLGVKECWSLGDAKVVWKKRVPIDQVPPWDQKAVRTLDCWRGQRVIQVGKDVVC